MDKLKKCAVSFSKLFDKEYYISAGKKGKLIEVNLFFHKEHFYHLLGLHKLRDIQKVRGDKSKIFDSIINDKLTYDDIARSAFFYEISDRLDYFTYLEQMIDSERIMIKHNKNKCKTCIEAKYIIYSTLNGINVHYFIDIDNTSQKYYGRTFFTRDDNAYIQDRPYKILKKTKTINNIILDITCTEDKSITKEQSGA